MKWRGLGLNILLWNIANSGCKYQLWHSHKALKTVPRTRLTFRYNACGHSTSVWRLEWYMDVLFVFSLGSVTNRCGINHSSPDSYEALFIIGFRAGSKILCNTSESDFTPITHFTPMIYLHIYWKRRKSRSFLTLSRGIEPEHRREMSLDYL